MLQANVQTKDISERFTGVKGVEQDFPEEMQQGVAKVIKYEFIESENPLYNLRYMRDGYHFMRMYEGKYVKLIVNGELMMSDTAMERKTNKGFIDKASGRVLIAGLGVGLVLKNICDKENVSEVVVIEKYQDVIDLVEPFVSHPKLKIICADIFTYDMAKTEKFDTIYFDIWAKISQENLAEMTKLHNKYRKNKVSKESFMDSWLRDFLRKERQKEMRESRGWW
jgi:hypothetical protein